MPGLLAVVSEGDLQQQELDQATADREAEASSQNVKIDNLAAHIRRVWGQFDSFRTSEQISQRIVDSLRAYVGEYTPAKLAEIKQFGGSDVYARITTVKCRGATAMLRDIFLGQERPWP